MPSRITGHHERTRFADEEVASFIPRPLPPEDPPLILGDPLGERLSAAEKALARLELAGEMVPSLDWFLYAFVRKEAVVSSQIEGTLATLVDLLQFEADAKSDDAISSSPDLQEICNYLDALRFARTELADDKGLPLSMRLVHEIHGRLMRGVRGADKLPGEIRRSQNWIGGSRPGNAAFVPPPPHALGDALGALERYIHSDDPLPPLVRAGLVHVQFETIHPYLDGNGRIGRLLVTLLLEHWGMLSHPTLYLSLFLKRHRAEYYRRLDNVRTEGDWEGWTDFFLDGVATIADEAVASARELFALFESDRGRLLAQDKTTLVAVRLFELLPRHPILTVNRIMGLVDITKPTAGKAVAALVEAGILTETTGKRRDRSWAYERYLQILRVGTDLEATPVP